jgi:hypothetical protein
MLFILQEKTISRHRLLRPPYSQILAPPLSLTFFSVAEDQPRLLQGGKKCSALNLSRVSGGRPSRALNLDWMNGGELLQLTVVRVTQGKLKGSRKLRQG